MKKSPLFVQGIRAVKARRRMMRARVIQIAMSTLLLAGSARAQDVARMDQVVKSYVPTQFMGTVLVARGEDVLLSKGYGSANLEWGIANTPTTKFRLGSLTKQFTAASILLLEERGKLKIDQPVKTYLPDAPTAWDKITLFNVLTHTAGLPNFTSFPDYRSTEPFPATPEQLVARFRDKPLDFEPGTDWRYSNSGYVLLGYLIERISGETYQRFVQENIFTPLGMKDSGYDSNAGVIARRAAGYAPGPNGPVNAGFIDMSIPFGAGGLYSTTEDLLRWEEGLFGGKVLSAASLQKMTTPFKNDYAFGLTVHTVNGHRVIDHNGGIEGFNTHLAYYPDSKITVAVLGNLSGPVPSQLAGTLGALAHGETIQLPSERTEITLAPEVLATYVGTYQMAPNIKNMVTLEDHQLFTQLSGQNKLPIFPESDTMFFLKVVDAELEFVKDEAGKVTAAVIHQNGRDLRGARISDTVEQPHEISVPGEILARYVGVYAFSPGADVTITLEAQQLMVQFNGQRKDPIFPESETLFFSKEVDAQIEFGRDAAGNPTLILHQGPGPARTALRK